VIELFTKRREEEGFTLIELLIVIVILGILAAIVVFAVGGTGKNAAASACSADAKSLEVALESYKAQTGTYPATVGSPADAAWSVLTSASSNSAGTGNGPYLRAVPDNWLHYQVWFDGSGSVWVAGPAASSSASYPATGSASNFDATTGACSSVAK